MQKELLSNLNLKMLSMVKEVVKKIKIVGRLVTPPNAAAADKNNFSFISDDDIFDPYEQDLRDRIATLESENDLREVQ